MADRRAKEIRHNNLRYPFPRYTTKAAWLRRRAALREHILFCMGLRPLPEKTPLNAKIFGRIEHDDYTVENVYFESYPGLIVAGNLYRPKGQQGPFPGVLNPHGHSKLGRLNDDEISSSPARLIQFARMGYVAFAYDMLGYNDTIQFAHKPLGPREALWSISSMGLQTWNSIRALDFLESLPDVDPKRLACTGESGGGTQTFILSALDDRVSVCAPVVMVSQKFQGGCHCENAPSLRLDTNNAEIAAMMAPRPMLLVACTQDWTDETPKVEFPNIRRIYRLFGAQRHVACVQLDSPHNYNRQSREAVYGFFAHYLSGRKERTPLPEKPFRMDPPELLRLFPDGKLPANAPSGPALVEARIQDFQAQLAAAWPKSKKDIARFREVYGDLLQRALCVEVPTPKSIEVHGRHTLERADGSILEMISIGRKDRGDQVPVALVRKPRKTKSAVTFIVTPEGIAGIKSGPLAESGPVASIDAFNTGSAGQSRDFSKVPHAYTYNRTDVAERVQDILTAVAYLRSRTDIGKINMVGIGEAGLWVLLARPFAGKVGVTIVDAAGFGSPSQGKEDDQFVGKLYVPHLRRAGDLMTAGALVAPSPLVIHDTGAATWPQRIAAAYKALGARKALRISVKPLSEKEVADAL